MKITHRYKTRTAEMYKRFAEDRPCDFSLFALQEMFLHDSYGKPQIDIESTNNGFFIGKFWMSVTINMWKEDINDGLLSVDELKNDFPDWFIKKIGV